MPVMFWESQTTRTNNSKRGLLLTGVAFVQWPLVLGGSTVSPEQPYLKSAGEKPTLGKL